MFAAEAILLAAMVGLLMIAGTSDADGDQTDGVEMTSGGCTVTFDSESGTSP